MNSGAQFSECRKYRYALWRIWDSSKPAVMFIGLNPSTADETANDPTIKRVISITKNLGYGGVVMCNCFPFISTNPANLQDSGNLDLNNITLIEWGRYCKDVVFAWGNFKIVIATGRDKALFRQFPNAMALHINANGSPKHPLYCKQSSQLVKFNLQ